MAIMSPTSIGNSANNQAPVPERAFTGNRHAAALAGGGHAFREVRLDASRGDRLREQFNFIISDYIDAKTGQAGAYRVKCDISERYLIQLNSATSQPVCQGGTAPWTGRQKFVVSFSTPAGTASVPVYAEVVAKAVPVVVAIRPVARGEVITASHLELRSADNVPPATQSRAAIQMLEQVVGLEARQPIQEGEMIFTDQVAEPQLVKRGELVTVVAAGGGIKVKTTARARQDGARGKIVQVETLDSRERFDARVTGPRETAVFTPALPQPQIATKETTAARR
jgi:flagella basal body P-ring formation protein FlgA